MRSEFRETSITKLRYSIAIHCRWTIGKQYNAINTSTTDCQQNFALWYHSGKVSMILGIRSALNPRLPHLNQNFHIIIAKTVKIFLIKTNKKSRMYGTSEFYQIYCKLVCERPLVIVINSPLFCEVRSGSVKSKYELCIPILRVL